MDISYTLLILSKLILYFVIFSGVEGKEINKKRARKDQKSFKVLISGPIMRAEESKLWKLFRVGLGKLSIKQSAMV